MMWKSLIGQLCKFIQDYDKRDLKVGQAGVRNWWPMCNSQDEILRKRPRKQI